MKPTRANDSWILHVGECILIFSYVQVKLILVYLKRHMLKNGGRRYSFRLETIIICDESKKINFIILTNNYSNYKQV
jgi:hypothetical protein